MEVADDEDRMIVGHFGFFPETGLRLRPILPQVRQAIDRIPRQLEPLMTKMRGNL
jgi:hypothetical protein